MKTLEILLVEDSASDAFLTQQALKNFPDIGRLSTVADGIEALDFLRRRGKYADAARPDLVFLDLNMPRKDGRELLAEVKNDPDLKRIPVVVLTSSSSERDLRAAYDLHANCYVVKSMDFPTFSRTVQAATAFWLNVASLPPR